MALYFHRITESLRLEKNSKIIQSNHHPTTPCPLTTSLSATSTQFLNTSRDSDATMSLGSCATASPLFWRRHFSCYPTSVKILLLVTLKKYLVCQLIRKETTAVEVFLTKATVISFFILVHVSPYLQFSSAVESEVLISTVLTSFQFSQDFSWYQIKGFYKTDNVIFLC